MGHQIRSGRFAAADEWYRWVVRSIDSYAVFSMDLENRIVTWDAGAERIFGYNRDDVVGENARFIFTLDDISKQIPEAEVADATAHNAALDERWHVKKDGTVFWASGLLMRVFDDRKRHVGFVKLVRECPPDTKA